MKEAFRKFSNKTSAIVGSPWAFIIAFLAIVFWAISGPIFGFSDTWQLVINTTTTIITFLMVFLIQNTQNRDNIALQLKLDELIRAMKGARNSLMDLEELSDDEIKRIQSEFNELCERRFGGTETIQDNNRPGDAEGQEIKKPGPGNNLKVMATGNPRS